jgi:hypothetical protein
MEMNEVQLETLEIADVLRAIKSYNVSHVTVGFDGCADEGQVSYVDVQPTTIDVMTALRPEHYDLHYYKTCLCLEELIEDLTYRILEDTAADWVNGDGGYGSVEVDLTTGRVSVDMKIREVTESEHDYVFDVGRTEVEYNG